MSVWQNQIDDLQRRLNAFNFEDHKEEDDGGAQVLLKILSDTCAVVRDADARNAGDLEAIVEKAHTVIASGIQLAYGSAGLFDFMPSFAHDDAVPIVDDTLTMPLGQGIIDALIPFFKEFLPQISDRSRSMPKFPGPGRWEQSVQPHANTTRLSRFRPNVVVSATDATPLASVIYQARCEITSDYICTPTKLLISPGSSFMAVAAAGGWKNRDPVVHYYHLAGEDTDDALEQTNSFQPGLSGVAYAMAMDEDRKLVFVADSDRIKSYRWAAASSGGDESQPEATHTLRSGGCEGGIAILPSGRIVRAGKGKAFVWNIDALETHGPNNKRIGKGKFNTENSWRDNDDDDAIELSTGSMPHATIQFADAKISPRAWHLHAPSGNMLCGENGRRDQGYGCFALDLEHGGRIAARFLGHGGDVENFSTSEGEPNLFATAGSDGYVRLFDMRHPMPAITFNAGRQDEPCSDVVFVHPDGIPTLFTAGQSSQQIKMWDVRARAAVYELATGNNGVVSMAWDARHSRLYAATECAYMDRLGYTHDYRPAKIPRWASEPFGDDQDSAMDEDRGEDEDGDDDYDSDDDEGRCWPQRAYHGENFFGYCFDAGDHSLFQYAFKADADPGQLPAYGQATMFDENNW